MTGDPMVSISLFFLQYYIYDRFYVLINIVNNLFWRQTTKLGFNNLLHQINKNE